MYKLFVGTMKTELTLGELIQQALIDLGWKNAELARRTGFSATHIGNLIRDYSPGTKSGRPTRLPAETVDKIADALKRPRSQFRKAAGLAFVDEGSNESIEEVLSRAQYFHAKGLSQHDLDIIRPILEALDRQIEELTKESPPAP